MSQIKKSSVITVAFLVTGTTVGSGILALPICIGLVGVIPGIVILVTACVFMAATGLVLANVADNRKDTSFDLPSIYESILGKGFKWIAIAANLIVLYGLIVAYLACLTTIAENTLDIHLPFMPLIIFVIITSMNLFAIDVIKKGNAVLVVILFVSFFVLVCFTGAHAQIKNFQHLNWILFPLSLPVLVNSFNFHNIIPTACRLLNFDRKRTYTAIILGLFFSFVISLVWCIVVIGALHYSDKTTFNIVYAFKHNFPATIPLGQLFHSVLFNITAVLFAVAAIITSYWTIGLALTNFIRDLRKHYLKFHSHLFDVLLAFIPPLVITIICPNIFISVQDIIGGIGIAVLFGILPSIILLKKLSGVKKILPIAMITFFSIVFSFAVLYKLGLLHYFK